MDFLTRVQWSPYAAGVGIGVLSCIAFVVSNRYLGCSSAFARTSGMLERLVKGKKVEQREYYKIIPPAIDWEWMLVLGVVIGAFASAMLSGQFHLQWVPDRWALAFGGAVWVRWVVALAGGIVMGFAARWAGGCTSGHGISGTLQLALSSWLAAMAFFVGGIVTALVLFKLVAG